MLAAYWFGLLDAFIPGDLSTSMSSSASMPSIVPAMKIEEVKPPVRACHQADNIRLIGGGWYGKGALDHAKNYGASMDLAACEANCLTDPNCKQYIWGKTGGCYSMVNEYGIRPESLDKNFVSGYCNSDGRSPPTKI